MFARFGERHLSDRDMILLGDGELSRRRAAKARRHLEQCWNCRGRFDALQGVILSFVQHCDAVTDGLGSAPDWPRIARRLPKSTGSKPLEMAFPRWRPTAIAATTLSICITVAFFHDGTMASARAAELLTQASGRDLQSLHSTPNAVIRQRLEVTSDARRAEWISWRAPAGEELRSQWSGDEGLKKEFLQVYVGTRLNRHRPLSPAAFLEWRAEARATTAAVRENSDRSITILLSARGPIQQSTLTLRQPDLHPTVQTVAIRTAFGSRSFEIRELSYSVVPSAELVPTVTEHVRKAPVSTAPALATWDRAQLEDAEASARLLLHERRADIRFEPQIVRQNRNVVVHMIVDTETDRDEWSEALARIPAVVPEIWTPDSIPTSFPIEAHSERTTKLYRTTAPMARELTRCLGSDAQANKLIDSFHSEVRAALAPALALERLAQRYAPDQPASSAAVEEKLRRIANGDWEEAHRHVLQFLALVNPVLNGCLVQQAGPAAIPSTPVQETHWREAGLTLARQIRTTDAYFNQLFTTQITAKAPAPEEDAVTQLRRLASELQSAGPVPGAASPRRTP